MTETLPASNLKEFARRCFENGRLHERKVLIAKLREANPGMILPPVDGS